MITKIEHGPNSPFTDKEIATLNDYFTGIAENAAEIDIKLRDSVTRSITLAFVSGILLGAGLTGLAILMVIR